MRKVVSLLFLISSLTISAQRVESVSGEYTYYAPSDKSMDEAKAIALNRAKIEALAEKYGTTITQNNFTNVNNSNEKSSVDFTSIGNSEVKGEWIETIGEPAFDISYVQNQLVIRVSVKGKVRELKRAVVNFSALALRNGTDDKFQSSEFKNGDDLFLSFKSPADGCVAVYLVDNSQHAYCILPYRNSPTGIMKVEHGKRYVFFSEKEAAGTPDVDEYTLTADKDVEQNQIYVIYSPNLFRKANDAVSSETLPRELDFRDFQKWLSSSRSHDKEMQVDVKNISIRKQ